MLQILEAVQAAYGHVPVAALKRISQTTGAWYAMLYGTATYYDHLAVGAPVGPDAAAPGSDFVAALDGALGGTKDAAGPGPSAAGPA